MRRTTATCDLRCMTQNRMERTIQKTMRAVVRDRWERGIRLRTAMKGNNTGEVGRTEGGEEM